MKYCYICNKKRKTKVVGTYIYKGEEIEITVCQWCRAVETRRNNKISN
jgi:uncharacterized protein CbrC (UPF0167 family)